MNSAVPAAPSHSKSAISVVTREIPQRPEARQRGILAGRRARAAGVHDDVNGTALCVEIGGCLHDADVAFHAADHDVIAPPGFENVDLRGEVVIARRR